MKKNILFLTFCCLYFNGISQDASVENSTFGIQTGLLGIWVHNESKISNSIALRSELGLDAGAIVEPFDNDIKIGYIPVITLEPRWYYNLDKRQKKSKRIDGNSGNFISLKMSYHPDLFYISNVDNVNIISDFSIIPTWAIRRHIGKHFTYETGIGVGYIHYFDDADLIYDDLSNLGINLHLRIGYRF